MAPARRGIAGEVIGIMGPGMTGEALHLAHARIEAPATYQRLHSGLAVASSKRESA
jgi:hypothetical protein